MWVAGHGTVVWCMRVAKDLAELNAISLTEWEGQLRSHVSTWRPAYLPFPGMLYSLASIATAWVSNNEERGTRANGCLAATGGRPGALPPAP